MKIEITDRIISSSKLIDELKAEADGAVWEDCEPFPEETRLVSHKEELR